MAISTLWRHNQFWCGSYLLNGDEGTIMQYGHFRVTAESGCWSVVEVFVLDLECVYWFVSSSVSPRTWVLSPRQGTNNQLMAAQLSVSIVFLIAFLCPVLKNVSKASIHTVYTRTFSMGFPIWKSSGIWKDLKFNYPHQFRKVVTTEFWLLSHYQLNQYNFENSKRSSYFQFLKTNKNKKMV